MKKDRKQLKKSGFNKKSQKYRVLEIIAKIYMKLRRSREMSKLAGICRLRNHTMILLRGIGILSSTRVLKKKESTIEQSTIYMRLSKKVKMPNSEPNTGITSIAIELSLIIGEQKISGSSGKVRKVPSNKNLQKV